MTINFISSKDNSNEICIVHTKSHNVEIMMGDETDDIIKELFESLLQNYQKGLEESMKESEFFFSPKWLKNKEATINPKNNDNNCFQYASTAALNHKQIKIYPDRISNLKLFIAQHNWKEINFPAQQKRLEKV